MQKYVEAFYFGCKVKVLKSVNPNELVNKYQIEQRERKQNNQD